MEKLSLSASKRTLSGRKVKKLRSEGILPANLYGKKVESVSLQLPLKDFIGIFAKAGETKLLELSLDGKKHPVLIHNIQYHPVTHSPLHVDFFQVDLKEKVTAKVPLQIIGEAKAVKDKLGVLLNILSEVEVEALPSDLPDKIEVDITSLSAIGDVVKIGDLKISDKVKVLTDRSSEIIKVAPLVSKEAEKMVAEEKAAAEAAAAQAAAVPSEEEKVEKVEEKEAVEVPPTKPAGETQTSPPAPNQNKFGSGQAQKPKV
jgi:large subunit ribosomal protein L25